MFFNNFTCNFFIVPKVVPKINIDLTKKLNPGSKYPGDEGNGKEKMNCWKNE